MLDYLILHCLMLQYSLLHFLKLHDLFDILFRISLLLLHYLNASVSDVAHFVFALFFIALFTVSLFNVALCQCSTILYFTVNVGLT